MLETNCRSWKRTRIHCDSLWIRTTQESLRRTGWRYSHHLQPMPFSLILLENCSYSVVLKEDFLIKTGIENFKKAGFSYKPSHRIFVVCFVFSFCNIFAKVHLLKKLFACLNTWEIVNVLIYYLNDSQIMFLMFLWVCAVRRSKESREWLPYQCTKIFDNKNIFFKLLFVHVSPSLIEILTLTLVVLSFFQTYSCILCFRKMC